MDGSRSTIRAGEKRCIASEASEIGSDMLGSLPEVYDAQREPLDATRRVGGVARAERRTRLTLWPTRQETQVRHVLLQRNPGGGRRLPLKEIIAFLGRAVATIIAGLARLCRPPYLLLPLDVANTSVSSRALQTYSRPKRQ